MYPYIENPAIARAMADNEDRWNKSDVEESKKEADKEEAERLAKKYGLQILMEWVWAEEAEYTREEYKAAYTKNDFENMMREFLQEHGEQPIALGIAMPGYTQYLALRTVRMAA